MRDTATVKGEAVCGHCQRSAEDWQPVECRVPRAATLLELLEVEYDHYTTDEPISRRNAEHLHRLRHTIVFYREEASRGAP